MGKDGVDTRGNLEVGGPEYIPKEDTTSRLARAQDGKNEVPGRTSGGQETKGE